MTDTGRVPFSLLGFASSVFFVGCDSYFGAFNCGVNLAVVWRSLCAFLSVV